VLERREDGVELDQRELLGEEHEGVLHQAFLDVDESGTEAAAATAVIRAHDGVALQPPPAVTVTVDHPFFFFIRDRATNTILFVGREEDPIVE
jgi:serpin B